MVAAKVNGKVVPADRELQNAGEPSGDATRVRRNSGACSVTGAASLLAFVVCALVQGLAAVAGWLPCARPPGPAP